MNSSIYVGSIAHRRHIPKKHRFRYPFFMWYLNLDELDQRHNLGKWFSTSDWALSRFYRPDYLGDPEEPLGDAVRRRMAELTGHPVNGQLFGLMNMRTLGLYFSPVNFYYAFSDEGDMTHFLAEVSNIPWNERHHYGHYVARDQRELSHAKAFHVSPFNPSDQNYRWRIEIPGDSIEVNLEVHDDRGHIFEARLHLNRHPLTAESVRKQLLKKPAMTAFVIAGIYWQAFRLFLKGVPFIPYQKETI